MLRQSLDFHSGKSAVEPWIPRRCHKIRWFQKRYSREQMRKTVPACRACHNAIHRFIPREKDLGRSFNTIASLRAHPEFAGFLEWVSRQR